MTAQLEEPRRLAAAQRGDSAALEWIFQTYHPAVYSLCYRLLSRNDDAEDATQATFVGAFRALPRFQGRSSLKTWLYRIAINEANRLLRVRGAGPALLDETRAVPLHAPDPVEKAAVEGILRTMRPDHRLILILFYWEELSCEEIASALDISNSAAKMRLKRARDEFQRRYRSEP